MGTNHLAIKNDARYLNARLECIARDKVCQHCGTDKDLTADHIVSLEMGGHPWDLANLQALCRSCNSRKGAGLDQAPVRQRWINPKWAALITPTVDQSDPFF